MNYFISKGAEATIDELNSIYDDILKKNKQIDNWIIKGTPLQKVPLCIHSAVVSPTSNCQEDTSTFNEGIEFFQTNLDYIV